MVGGEASVDAAAFLETSPTRRVVPPFSVAPSPAMWAQVNSHSATNTQIDTKYTNTTHTNTAYTNTKYTNASAMWAEVNFFGCATTSFGSSHLTHISLNRPAHNVIVDQWVCAIN